jgi:serine protease Do
MYFDGTEGVIVADTDPDSPARKAGIQAWDRILRIDGKPVNAVMEEDLPAARRVLGLLPKKQPAKVELLREGKSLTVEMTPREKGKVEGDQLDCPRWDLTVKAINQFENPELYFHRKAGVFVQAVRHPGNAAAAGLQGQDIVVKIGGKEVASLDDVKQIHKKSLENVGDSHRVLITILRNGLMKQVVLDFSRDHSKE